MAGKRKPQIKPLKQRLLEPPLLTLLSDHELIAEKSLDQDAFDLAFKMGPVYDIVRHPETRLPITIGIHGDWGAGKTSAMKWLEGRLQEWNALVKTKKKAAKIQVHPVWFYPWKYHEKEDVWRGLVAEVILACLRMEGTTVDSLKFAIGDFGRFLGKSFIDLAAATKLKVPGAQFDGKVIADLAETAKGYTKPEAAYLNEFEEAFESWVGKTLGNNQRMIVFIDDLDRCLPEIALQVLEALKLYLRVPNLIFVIGVDKKVVNAQVEKHYEGLKLPPEKKENYLAKLFQVEVVLAPSELQIEDYLAALVNDYSAWKELNGKAQEVFSNVIRGLGERSPREMKRLVNSTMIAGAGANLGIGSDNQNRKTFTLEEGAQVFLVRRILELPENGRRGDLVGSKAATNFFHAWSKVVTGDAEEEAKPPSHWLTRNLLERLGGQSGHGGLGEDDGPNLRPGTRTRRPDSSTRTRRPGSPETDQDIPQSYRDIFSNSKMESFLDLLRIDLLFELMKLLFPEEGALIGGAMERRGDAEIVANAIAREFDKDFKSVTKEELANLTVLDLNDTPIADLSEIKILPALERLNLSRTQAMDLSPLAGLKAITYLYLDGTQVSDLTPLVGLEAITDLILYDTQVADLSPLAGLAAINTLDLDSTQVADLTPLAGLTGIEYLYLARTEVVDLSPLQGLAGIKFLTLAGTQVADLTPLRGLKKLISLSLENTKVSNKSIKDLQRTLPDLKISR